MILSYMFKFPYISDHMYALYLFVSRVCINLFSVIIQQNRYLYCVMVEIK